MGALVGTHTTPGRVQVVPAVHLVDERVGFGYRLPWACCLCVVRELRRWSGGWARCAGSWPWFARVPRRRPFSRVSLLRVAPDVGVTRRSCALRLGRACLLPLPRPENLPGHPVPRPHASHPSTAVTPLSDALLTRRALHTCLVARTALAGRC